MRKARDARPSAVSDFHVLRCLRVDMTLYGAYNGTFVLWWDGGKHGGLPVWNTLLGVAILLSTRRRDTRAANSGGALRELAPMRLYLSPSRFAFT